MTPERGTATPPAGADVRARPGGSAAEVFGTFLRLGLTSFGGPIAHLGYFRNDIVLRRRWLDDRAYADLVALCQFLPGPTSSQVGFALGLSRAGWPGALAAFAGFTLPSALLMVLFAMVAPRVGGPAGAGALHGLKIVAVAVVAQAVWGMARSLCPDLQRAGVAVAAVVLLALVPGAAGMLGAIVAGAVAGLVLCRGEAGAPACVLHLPLSRAGGLAALAAFAGLLVLLPILAGQSQALAVLDSFSRAGALVFGGGHVVLPLLEGEVVARGWVSHDAFLAGYGAAQAVPGPLFTFATYLGAVLDPAPNGWAGAALALVAVFLPGFLILAAALPFWNALRARPAPQAMMRGANAAVVGILGAALYDPIFTTAVLNARDLGLAVACIVLLMVWKAPAWIVVLVGAAGGVALALT